jgi:hypothetical protein
MKEKEMREKITNEVETTPACARVEDLMAYLYGEADEAEARSFAAHTEHCASCRKELTEFKQVRAAIGEWRAQALGAPASATTAASSPVVSGPINAVPERKRSALAAIREFFTLSPAWMRAGAAAFGLIFCALVALTVAHYVMQPKTVTVEKIVTVRPSEEELNAMVETRMRQKAETLAVAPKDDSSGLPPTKTDDKEPVRQKPNRAVRQDVAGQTKLAGTPGLKISPQESREIARDLRLTIAANDEDDLPRLSDLIDESN